VNQLTGGSMASTRLLLSRQEESGKVFRIKRGYYMTREFWLQNKHDLNFTAMISAIIQPHSYLTGVWVLQKYGVMTEGIYLVTAATLKHTRSISNKLASFHYFHIRKNYLIIIRKPILPVLSAAKQRRLKLYLIFFILEANTRD